MPPRQGRSCGNRERPVSRYPPAPGRNGHRGVRNRPGRGRVQGRWTGRRSGVGPAV